MISHGRWNDSQIKPSGGLYEKAATGIKLKVGRRCEHHPQALRSEAAYRNGEGEFGELSIQLSTLTRRSGTGTCGGSGPAPRAALRTGVGFPTSPAGAVPLVAHDGQSLARGERRLGIRHLAFHHR